MEPPEVPKGGVEDLPVVSIFRDGYVRQVQNRTGSCNCCLPPGIGVSFSPEGNLRSPSPEGLARRDCGGQRIPESEAELVPGEVLHRIT